MRWIRELKMIWLLLFLLCICIIRDPIQVEAEEKVLVEYYYYNSCDGCTEGAYFEQEFKEKLKDVIGENEYEFVLKDVSNQELYDEFIEITKDHQTENVVPVPPLLKVGETCLFGLDEITERSRDVMIQQIQASKRDAEGILHSLKGIDPKDTFFVYFYVPGCKDCDKVQKYFEAMDKTFYSGGNKVSDLKIVYVNLGDFENVPLALWFYETYQVGENDRKAPAVFYQNGFLQGFADIRDGIPEIIESGAARNWEDISYMPGKEGQNFTLADWGILVVTGLANGLNPCGLSILLLLISLLLTKRERIWKLGLAFIGAKLLTYLLLGTVFSSMIEGLSTYIIGPAGQILRIVLASIALLFALLNFVDLYHARKEKYGKIRMQLPAKLKRFNNNYLQKVVDKGSKSMVGLVFLAGVVVSAGEFLCTGQLYLASIIYVMEKQGAFSILVFGIFAVYLLCMCIPLLLITLLADKSAGLISISELVRKHTPVIKLVYGILFLVFAAIILLFR